jgi:hypothetical protein
VVSGRKKISTEARAALCMAAPNWRAFSIVR